MLGRQRRDVAALAAREELARARERLAAARLVRARRRFLGNPLNLLMPFAAGVFGGALALRRKPAPRRDGRHRDGASWNSLLKTATTLWGLSLPLREALLDARAARVDETTAPPVPPGRQPAPPA